MSDLEALTLLDAERSERFSLAGEAHVNLVPAADLQWQWVAECAEDDRAFIEFVAGRRHMPARDIGELRLSWVAHQGLLVGDDLRRLVWMVGTFSRPLAVDLRRLYGVSLGDLWRDRRWRELLELIDYLPRASWSQMAIANHPEHADRMAKAIAQRRLDTFGTVEEDPGPPLVEFTPEVAMLANVVDAISAVRHAIIQVNSSSKGPKPKPPPPMPRPRTLVDRLVEKQERIIRWGKHEALADRLLARRKNKD